MIFVIFCLHNFKDNSFLIFFFFLKTFVFFNQHLSSSMSWFTSLSLPLTQHDSQWSHSKCSVCTCSRGKVTCGPRACPPLSCGKDQSPFIPDGDCCPVCAHNGGTVSCNFLFMHNLLFVKVIAFLCHCFLFSSGIVFTLWKKIVIMCLVLVQVYSQICPHPIKNPRTEPTSRPTFFSPIICFTWMYIMIQKKLFVGTSFTCLI